MASDAYFARCAVVREDFSVRYPVGTAGAMSARIVSLEEEVKALREKHLKAEEEHAKRSKEERIVGLCQHLSDEMLYWAENEARSEDDRDEILDTIRHLMKQIEDVEIVPLGPDEDFEYEVARDRAMGWA